MKQCRFALSFGLLIVLAFPATARGQEGPTAEPAEVTIDVVPLKGRIASVVAEWLDETFNGKSDNRAEARILVFAVPGTNYLFIMASSTDLRVIREILRP